MADDRETSATMARSILIGKVANSRAVLRRAIRDHGERVDRGALDDGAQRLSGILQHLRQGQELNRLRGFEGEAAQIYFSVFDHLILSNKNDFIFIRRSRRPPLDRINCLLSFVYTLLMHDVRSALESVGLDPAVGFLHRDRPGRPGLALDLMEEFRPVLADRLVLSLVNLGQITNTDFQCMESGAVLLTDKGRKTVLTAYQKRKQEKIIHPFLNEKMAIGLLCYAQALLLARYIRGDLDGYPVFCWR